MAIELAKAYVQIVPSSRGLGDSVTKMFETAGDKAGRAGGEKGGNAMLSTISKVVTGAAIAKGLSSLTSTITKVAKSAVQGYSAYEQLIGGVETLFTKTTSGADLFVDSISGSVDAIKEFQAANALTVDGIIGPQTMAAIEEKYGKFEAFNRGAAEMVRENAANAFKTAGLSANAYMETVTSFSASLLQSLGGDTYAAAEYADMAITDMADNANKMGSSMESIQNAYQGFAKQNYTMLDNLKLGYGGTKEEMQRLLTDAEKLDSSFIASRDENDKLTMSYSDIVDAIHIVQTEMGITGTTALEASSTISGSWASLGAAWSNVLVGIADDTQDFGALVGNLADSALTFADNVMPRIMQALSGVGALIEGLAPMITAQLPGLVDAVLPGLLSAAMSLVESVVAVLPSLLQTILSTLLSCLPQITQVGIDLFLGLVQAMPEIISQISAALPQIVDGIVTTFLNNIPQIIDAGVQLLTALIQNLPQIIEAVCAAIPQIVRGLISAVIGSIPQLVNAGYNLMLGLGQGIKSAVSALWETMKAAIGGIIDGAKSLLGIRSPSRVFAEIGAYTMEGFAQGILRNENLVAEAMEDASALASGSFTAALTLAAANVRPTLPAANAAASSEDVAQAVAQGLRNVRVYLDGNRLVGYLVPDIDAALGGRQVQAARGAI